MKNLVEEASEVIQRVSKLQRFGKDEVQRDQPYTNAQRLGREFGQLLYIGSLALKLGLMSKEELNKGLKEKGPRLRKYAQFAPDDWKP